jgi:hypothetical protein
VQDFNQKAFINANDRPFGEVIEEVRQAHKNGGSKYLSQTPFKNNVMPDCCNEEVMLRFFRRIFE